MVFVSATNPRTINGGILLDATFDTGETGEYFSLPNDVSEHGRQVYERALSGEFGEIRQYVAPQKTNEELLASVKVETLAGIELTDRVLWRCQKNGVLWPSEWQQYYQELLSIYRLDEYPEGGVAIPSHPSFPEGT